MEHETIKSELRKKGYTLAMIAEALSCSPTNIQQVSKRLNQSHRVANAIATALELDVKTVFPDVPSYTEVNYLATSRQQRIEALQQRLAS
jgi:lambda repressor-like predicted transcriptional regulator